MKNAAKAVEIQAARELWQKWELETLPGVTEEILTAWNAFEKYRSTWDAQQLAINFKIQAGGSDVIRKSEVLLEIRLPFPARVLLSNHDEICVSCPKAMAAEVAKIVQEAMHEAFNSLYPNVPVETKIEILTTWK